MLHKQNHRQWVPGKAATLLAVTQSQTCQFRYAHAIAVHAANALWYPKTASMYQSAKDKYY
jgi:hypothetical protein